MVQFNVANKEIILKVVYYGPALSGKTTNLQQLHARINSSASGKMISLTQHGSQTAKNNVTNIPAAMVGVILPAAFMRMWDDEAQVLINTCPA